MVTIDCPWCEEAALLPFPQTEEAAASFTCVECGTTIAWVDESVALDLAA